MKYIGEVTSRVQQQHVGARSFDLSGLGRVIPFPATRPLPSSSASSSSSVVSSVDSGSFVASSRPLVPPLPLPRLTTPRLTTPRLTTTAATPPSSSSTTTERNTRMVSSSPSSDFGVGVVPLWPRASDNDPIEKRADDADVSFDRGDHLDEDQQEEEEEEESDSDYLSFDDDDDNDGENVNEDTKEEKEARERERRMVLEAAGLIVHVDEKVRRPPLPSGGGGGGGVVGGRRLSLKGRKVSLTRDRKGLLGGGVGIESVNIGSGSDGDDDDDDDDDDADSTLVREKEKRKRRPPPAIPVLPSLSVEADGETRLVTGSSSTTLSSGRRRRLEEQRQRQPPMPPRPRQKRLRPIPSLPPPSPEEARYSIPNSPDLKDDFDPDEHAKKLDDAFERYESFRNSNLGWNHQQQQQNSNNRLSVVSATSTDTSSLYPPASPATTMASLTSNGRESSERTSSHATRQSLSNISSHFHSHFGSGRSSSEEPRTSSPSNTMSGGSRYGQFLQFLSMGGRSRESEEGSSRKLVISGPIAMSGAGGGSGGEVEGLPSGIGESDGPAFGSSWASLVDKTALEGIPVQERKRQEAIFELINTEVAYVRDLQLIVEVFYSSILNLLSRKEMTVIFANIEDILLTNTAFVSSLEERQKDCRLYVDKVGDTLLKHIPSMGVYLQYCVNQATAIKMLRSLREANPDLAAHLQRIRDSDPSVRNLDLSSYLLAPMQRITRYPLLIKQILHYTEGEEEERAIRKSQEVAERILDHINETIREQEGREKLKSVSENLWIGQGRLDLTAPTRYMGTRKLLKEGLLLKAKSGRKVSALLCSDILVLMDESMKTLYRMPIPLVHAQVKEIPNGPVFQISQPYPRGGDSIMLKGTSSKDTMVWIRAITHAARKCRHAAERGSRR